MRNGLGGCGEKQLASGKSHQAILARSEAQASAINSYDLRRAAWSKVIVTIITSSAPYAAATDSIPFRTVAGDPIMARRGRAIVSAFGPFSARKRSAFSI